MSDRSEKWHATRRVRELALFADKRFEVVREVKNEEFETPLGYKGKNGYEIRNIDTDEIFKVGKSTLKRMAEEYKAVALPPAKKRGRPKKVQFASGGVIQGPGGKGDDSIPMYLSLGEQYYSSAEVRDQENGNDPGAHPVSEEPTDDARSGSLAGPTYANANADVHLEA